jgi:hypothetical protein
LGAGDVVHRAQIGASQVPLQRLGTFQSHSSVAARPQAQRLRLNVPQTIATPPLGNETRSQVTEGSRCARRRPEGGRHAFCQRVRK